MNHLTDEQLAQVLYQEPSAEIAAWMSHLDHCEKCKNNFESWSEVHQQLTGDVVVPPPFEVNVSAIVDPERRVEVMGTSSPGMARRFPGSLVALATSVVLFVAAASFMTGTMYQSGQATAAIQSEIATAIELANRYRDSGPAESGIPERIQEQFSLIQDSLAEREGSISGENLAALQGITLQIVRLLDEQRSLRDDFQTMAVNAQGEITMAKRDIRRINEFVSMLATGDPRYSGERF